jgi:hypothetical protein
MFYLFPSESVLLLVPSANNTFCLLRLLVTKRKRNETCIWRLSLASVTLCSSGLKMFDVLNYLYTLSCFISILYIVFVN